MNRPGTNDTEKERAASALTAEMQKHISSFYAVFLIFAVSAYGSVRLTIEFGEDAVAGDLLGVLVELGAPAGGDALGAFGGVEEGSL